MTLLPAEPKRIERAPEGMTPIDTFSNYCSNPLCTSDARDMHHIVRRSYAGNNTWVVIDGIIMPNVCGLCRPCHDLITNNKAQIVYENHEYRWSQGGNVMPLEPPPPQMDKPPVFPEPRIFAARVCPTCERPLPKPKPDKPEEKRPRRTWSVTVPKDERENGAEMLDVLIEETRAELGKAGLPYGEADSVKYFVLSTALALFVHHAEEFLGEGA